MDFGAQVNAYRTSWSEISSVIEVMEAGRWHSLWFADHFLAPGPAQQHGQAAFEAFSLISAAAGMTQRLRLGHLVLGNTYRNPALVAKMAATIDQISGGRFVLGIGAGWFEREHDAYGWDFPSMRDRSDRFEEACALIRALFKTDGGSVDFDGRYYQLREAPLSPGCVQTPHVPILVGGTGERRTLRTLALHGDAMNVDGWAGAGMSVDLYRHKAEVLERHCEEVGRDPSEIRHTVLVPTVLSDDKTMVDKFISRLGETTIAGTASYIVDRVGELVGAGVDEIMFGSPAKPAEDYQRFDEEVLAQFD
ncbi:MAG: LLM class flavin-dependent oxidoreductase [Acidimicrobiia bacterium]|nr:LLM class flavin-dependent oxidoreductase [Acidimicrobiia bacterium]